MRKFLSFWLIALTLCAPSYAADETELAKKTVTSLQYVKAKLAERQDKVEAQSGTKAMTYGNNGSYDPGEISARDVKTSLGSSTTDPALPTVGAVNTGLNAKQNKVPAKDTNTVITYTGTAGVIGEKGIYQNNGSYAAQSDNLVDAGTFNAALKTGLDSEFICAESDSSTGLCWLWTIHNEGKSNNLLDDSFMDNSTYRAVTVNGVTTNYAKILPTENGKTYTLSATLTSDGTYYYYLKEIYPDGTGPTEANNQCPYMWNNNGASNPNTTQTKTCHFTTRNNATYLVYFAGGTSSISHLTLTNYQMEEGSSATPYQPYMSPRPYTTLVPSGYTPIEYIETTGTQWIDTGIRGHMGYTYDLDFQQTTTGNFRTWGVFNQSNYVGPNMSFTYCSGWCSRWESVAGQQRSVTLPSIDTNRHNLHISNGKIYFDDVYKGISEGHNSSFVFNYNLFLGTINPGGSTPTTSTKAKIYSYRVWDTNGTLIQNLVPAKQGSVVGMYDTVGGTFKTNVSGSGTFTAGPEINNNVYMPQEQ